MAVQGAGLGLGSWEFRVSGSVQGVGCPGICGGRMRMREDRVHLLLLNGPPETPFGFSALQQDCWDLKLRAPGIPQPPNLKSSPRRPNMILGA